MPVDSDGRFRRMGFYRSFRPCALHSCPVGEARRGPPGLGFSGMEAGLCEARLKSTRPPPAAPPVARPPRVGYFLRFFRTFPRRLLQPRAVGSEDRDADLIQE